LVEEVRGLLDMGYEASLTSLKTIDYKQTVEYIQGTLSLSEYIQSLQIANHQLAKKQRTWFRRYTKDAEKLALHEQQYQNIKYLNFYLPDYFS